GLVGREDEGHLTAAGLAPRGPEVDQNRMTGVMREAIEAAVEGLEGKAWSGLSRHLRRQRLSRHYSSGGDCTKPSLMSHPRPSPIFVLGLIEVTTQIF